MPKSDRYPQTAQRVKVIDQTRDYKGYTKSLSANTDLQTLIGEALPEDVIEVLVNNISGNSIYYQADGNAADATAFTIQAGASYIISGYDNEYEDIFSKVRLFAAIASDVSIMVRIFAPA